ncbi:MAG TPA: MFS transporter [Thermomicrobiales bacterium]|nr:MFS transporter [Thermomicrobiales bacterium]
MTTRADAPIQLGLRANWRQFWLLVLVNAFVGAMIGLERTVVPLLAEEEFGLAAASAATSFIVSFGLVKAFANLFAGRFSDRVGRKQLLVIGWLFALPVPLIIIVAPNWWWIVFANVLLGVNQGFTWSTTVIMKIDLVGPVRRGLAMGLNEFAGYFALAGSALLTGWLAATYGLRPEPFLIGFVIALAGLLLSIFGVKETRGHAQLEARLRALDAPDTPGAPVEQPSFWSIFTLTSWRNRNLFSCSQAGMVNNLNDGLAWGLLPLFFAAGGLSVGRIGVLAAIYPAVWGLTQLGTGLASDRLGRKWLIAAGMWTQALAIAFIVTLDGFTAWAGAAALLGLGTAMVYPTLLAAIADNTSPDMRGTAVGVYRLWRDSGYAAGALMAGIVADALGLDWAIWSVAALTLASGVVVALVMRERRVNLPAGLSAPNAAAAAIGESAGT